MEILFFFVGNTKCDHVLLSKIWTKGEIFYTILIEILLTCKLTSGLNEWFFFFFLSEVKSNLLLPTISVGNLISQRSNSWRWCGWFYLLAVPIWHLIFPSKNSMFPCPEKRPLYYASQEWGQRGWLEIAGQYERKLIRTF